MAALGAGWAEPGALEQVLSTVDLVMPTPGIPAGHRLFALATNLTEVFVVSALERGPDGNVR